MSFMVVFFSWHCHCPNLSNHHHYLPVVYTVSYICWKMCSNCTRHCTAKNNPIKSNLIHVLWPGRSNKNLVPYLCILKYRVKTCLYRIMKEPYLGILSLAFFVSNVVVSMMLPLSISVFPKDWRYSFKGTNAYHSGIWRSIVYSSFLTNMLV